MTLRMIFRVSAFLLSAISVLSCTKNPKIELVYGVNEIHYSAPALKVESLDTSGSLSELAARIDSSILIVSSGEVVEVQYDTTPGSFLRISPGGEHALIQAKQIDDDTFNHLVSLFKQQSGNQLRTLVWDLRGCSGGRVRSIVDILEFSAGKKDELFRVKTKTKEHAYFGKKDIQFYEHSICLVDKNTASGAEILVYNLQRYSGCKVYGDTTKGMGLIRAPHKLNKEWQALIPISEVYIFGDFPLTDNPLVPEGKLGDQELDAELIKLIQ